MKTSTPDSRPVFFLPDVLGKRISGSSFLSPIPSFPRSPTSLMTCHYWVRWHTIEPWIIASFDLIGRGWDMPKDSFVIMPFSATETCTEAEWTEIFENVFRPAFIAVGYSCERAKPETGNLISSIVERLRNARIVLADITDRNANVFYELGVRHSLSHRTIIVARDDRHIPSDLRGYWSITYGIRPKQVADFACEICRLTELIENDPERSDSPVSDYLRRAWVDLDRANGISSLKKITALVTELTGTKAAIEHCLKTGEQVFINCDCLTLLLQTLYVDLGPDVLRQAYELRSRLMELPRGGYSQRSRVVNRIDSLLDSLIPIRRQMAAGEFVEPGLLSTMEWSGPKDGGLEDSGIQLLKYPVDSGLTLE